MTAHLEYVRLHGHGHLTENERDLINMASLMVRARFGDTVLSPEEVSGAIGATLRSVLRDISKDDGQGVEARDCRG